MQCGYHWIEVGRGLVFCNRHAVHSLPNRCTQHRMVDDR